MKFFATILTCGIFTSFVGPNQSEFLKELVESYLFCQPRSSTQSTAYIYSVNCAAEGFRRPQRRWYLLPMFLWRGSKFSVESTIAEWRQWSGDTKTRRVEKLYFVFFHKPLKFCLSCFKSLYSIIFLLTHSSGVCFQNSPNIFKTLFLWPFFFLL